VFRQIVVPLDGSPLAEAILPHVCRLAAGTPLKVLLLSVVPMPPNVEQYGSFLVSDAIDQQKHSREAYLERHSQELAANGVAAGHEVRVGDPATEIVRYAEEVLADAIAMSTHGRTRVDRLLHGSVAGAVLRTALLPLLLVRPGERAFDQPAQPIEPG